MELIFKKITGNSEIKKHVEYERLYSVLGDEDVVKIDRKRIEGKISLDFVSSGDPSEFINDDGSIKEEKLFSEIVKKSINLTKRK